MNAFGSREKKRPACGAAISEQQFDKIPFPGLHGGLEQAQSVATVGGGVGAMGKQESGFLAVPHVIGLPEQGTPVALGRLGTLFQKEFKQNRAAVFKSPL